MCDKGKMVEFTSDACMVSNLKSRSLVLNGKRPKTIYKVDIMTTSETELTCFSALNNDSLFWHKRLGHASFSLLNKLILKDLVVGLPKSKFKDENFCDGCEIGKHVKSSFKSNKVTSTTRPLELLHMDMCGPMRVGRGEKRYVFMIVDDYSRFTWTLFLVSKV